MQAAADNIIDFQTYRNHRVRVAAEAPAAAALHPFIPPLPVMWPAYWVAYWMYVPSALAAANERKNG